MRGARSPERGSWPDGRPASQRQAGRPAGRRARRFPVAAMAAALAVAAWPGGAARAQQVPEPDTRHWLAGVSHWGKWIALGGAAGLTAVAILRNQDADQVYDGLRTFCRAGPDACVLNAQGKYVNAEAETLYQETLRLDSQARRWMLGGQVMLAAAGGMFLIDLVAGTRKPKNIPYTPLEFFADGRSAGLRWSF